MSKKWYKTWWGILGVIILFPISIPSFLLAFFTYQILRKKLSLNLLFISYVILAFIGFIGALISAPASSIKSQNVKITSNNRPEESNTPTTLPRTNTTDALTNTLASKPINRPNPTSKPEFKKITDKINSLASEKYPDFEATIWNEKRDFAVEGQTPYEIVLNGSFNKTIVSDCNDAKKLSYYMLETFYKDNEIRPELSRILITIPYYLRVSLGSGDGIPMAEKGSFSGPTNFWTVMEKMGLGENENGDMKNRTWGVYLSKCN